MKYYNMLNALTKSPTNRPIMQQCSSKNFTRKYTACVISIQLILQNYLDLTLVSMKQIVLEEIYFPTGAIFREMTSLRL